jgi:hypothetical protein
MSYCSMTNVIYFVGTNKRGGIQKRARQPDKFSLNYLIKP